MDAVIVDPIPALLLAGEGKMEWVRGSLLRMPPPSFDHEILRGFLQTLMTTYTAKHRLGEVLGEAYFERLESDIVRAPDIAFFRKSSLTRITPNYSEGGADFVIEIVSPSSRGRDRFDKRHDYERAGIEEYWVVDFERREAEFYRLYWLDASGARETDWRETEHYTLTKSFLEYPSAYLRHLNPS